MMGDAQSDVTGVLRDDDKEETERLARLLLSVGPNKHFRKRRIVRWRQYFDKDMRCPMADGKDFTFLSKHYFDTNSMHGLLRRLF